MSERLQRAARTKLRELDIQLPKPFTAEALCATISERRGRPIRVMEMDVPESGCGLWVETADVDYFIITPTTSRAHHDHIVLHELAHVLYDHRGVLGNGYARLNLPNLSPALIQRVFGRGAYSDQEEQEAEVMASVLMERAAERRAGPAADDEAQRVLDRLSQVLE